MQFASENWWVGEAPGTTPDTPAKYFIDAIEDSHLLLFDATSPRRQVESIPGAAFASVHSGLARRKRRTDRASNPFTASLLTV